MLLHPAIMGLLVCEALSVAVLLGASVLGVRIAAGWDATSANSRQHAREQRAALVSSAVGFAMAFQVLSLFLLVEAADRMQSLFTGAMCAAGTLHANAFGYPALLTKIAAVLCCGTWLVIHHADGRSPDYPLLRVKFFLLPPAALVATAGGVLLFLYALRLDPEIITSCCGVLFDAEGTVLGDGLPRLGSIGGKALFFALLAWTMGVGRLPARSGRGAVLYGASSLAAFVTCMIAVLSFISPCWYQLPTHHCPFCILRPEYHRAGYLLYAAIFAGGVFGAGAGALALVTGRRKTRSSTQGLQGRLCRLSMIAYAFVAAVAAWPLLFSDFKLDGY